MCIYNVYVCVYIYIYETYVYIYIYIGCSGVLGRVRLRAGGDLTRDLEVQRNFDAELRKRVLGAGRAVSSRNGNATTPANTSGS